MNNINNLLNFQNNNKTNKGEIIIEKITTDKVIFDNGNVISFNHNQDWYEYNYVDFVQIDDIAKNTEFDKNIVFEEVKDSGFRFGNNNGRMFFVPCYSEQNRYYTNELKIYIN